MKINHIDIKDLIKEEDIEKELLTNYGNGILLSNNHIEILNKYDIDYRKFNSINSLIYEIENCLNDNEGLDTDDLEWVSMHLAEINYYYNTRK